MSTWCAILTVIPSLPLLSSAMTVASGLKALPSLRFYFIQFLISPIWFRSDCFVARHVVCFILHAWFVTAIQWLNNFLQFTAEEVAAIMKDFDEPGSLAPTGLFLGGAKYMVIQGEAGAVIRGKKVMTPFFYSVIVLLILKSWIFFLPILTNNNNYLHALTITTL